MFSPAGVDAVFEVGGLLFPSRNRPDLWEQLGGISAPTLILGGSSDIVPVEMLESLADAFPNGALAIIQEAGHFSFIEAPNEYSQAIEDFLGASG